MLSPQPQIFPGIMWNDPPTPKWSSVLSRFAGGSAARRVVITKSDVMTTLVRHMLQDNLLHEINWDTCHTSWIIMIFLDTYIQCISKGNEERLGGGWQKKCAKFSEETMICTLDQARRQTMHCFQAKKTLHSMDIFHHAFAVFCEFVNIPNALGPVGLHQVTQKHVQGQARNLSNNNSIQPNQCSTFTYFHNKWDLCIAVQCCTFNLSNSWFG